MAQGCHMWQYHFENILSAVRNVKSWKQRTKKKKKKYSQIKAIVREAYLLPIFMLWFVFKKTSVFPSELLNIVPCIQKENVA